MPKQFLKLFDDKSLFQLTIERNSKICDKSVIVSNEEQYFLALDQIDELENEGAKQKTQFMLEEIGKNTAPAIALSCMSLDKDDIVLVTPSDHLIKNEKEYKKVVNLAQKLAEQNYLVTFGITPTEPNTGYGYIQAKPKDDEYESMDVELFHEKPDIQTATKYLEKNSHFDTHHSSLFLWNSGMFCFKAGVFLDELKRLEQNIYDTCKKAYENKKTLHSTSRIQRSFMEAIPSESIDYAVMEKSD
jgi:mannose-1-phosphate guanylyltransferase